MTLTDIMPQRVNRLGDPCPDWCNVDHGELLVPGEPSFGYMNGHASDPMTGQLGPKAVVRLRRSGLAGEAARVAVDRYALPVLSLAPDKAAALADLLESLTAKSDLEQLADELRTAAGIIGPAPGSDSSDKA